MNVKGKIINGSVVPDKPLNLPEGTEVSILAADPVIAAPTDEDNENSPTLFELLKDVIGSVELPADFAMNHDHYIHGTKKRAP